MTISLTYVIMYTRGVAKGIALGGYSMRRRSQPCLLIRRIRLREGIWLSIYDYQLHDDLVVRGSDYFQELGFSFFLQGEYTYDDVLHEAGQHLVCGSGNEAAAVRKEFTKQRFLQIDLGLQPGVLRSFMGNDSGELPPELQHLVHSPEQPSNWHLGTTCYEVLAFVW